MDHQGLINQNQDQKVSYRHARDSPIRFALLFMLIVMGFANQYTFNNPQALEESIEEILNISETEFQLFYSLLALPNLITLLIIGYVVDLFGVRSTLVVLSSCIAAFQLVISVGGYLESYKVILIGRILYGVVAEAIFIPMASMISFWFHGKEQAFALGILITFPEFGDAFNSYLTPIIFQHTGSLGHAFLLSFGLCLLGLECSTLAVYIDQHADKVDKSNDIVVNQTITCPEQSQKINLSDFQFLYRQFWIIAIICALAISLWTPFLDNANKMFEERFCYDEIGAGKIMMWAYLVAAMSCIPIGMLIDFIGKRRLMICIGITVFLIAQLILLVYPQCSDNQIESGIISAVILEGIGNAIYANAIVASIPLVVPKKILGTAFGIMQMLESFFQFVIPIITGILVDDNPNSGYRFSSGLFVFLAFCAEGFCFSLFYTITNHAKHRMDRRSSLNKVRISRLNISEDTQRSKRNYSNTIDLSLSQRSSHQLKQIKELTNQIEQGKKEQANPR